MKADSKLICIDICYKDKYRVTVKTFSKDDKGQFEHTY